MVPAAVSIHKFAAGRFDKERLADDIAAYAGEMVSTLPGLLRVMVLSGYGGRHVTVVAEWETHDAWAAGTETLYADPRLRELAAGTGQGENEGYVPVAVAQRPV